MVKGAFQQLFMKNNTNHPTFFLLFLLLFLPNFNSFCTISLLTSVAHIAAKHNPADGRQRK